MGGGLIMVQQYVKKILKPVKSFAMGRYILKSEREFKIESEPGRIKYLFLPNKKSDKLLVIFSGFPIKGKPPVYNYVRAFNNIKCNKLFILDDFGNDYRGTYYLGTNENWFLVDEITNLISYIKDRTGIKNENITLAGSSKGGFASLYYAFKDAYGSVIVGEPQIKVGDYLSETHHLGVFNNIMGEYSTEKRDKLNRALFEVMEHADGNFPNKILVVCGKNNNYYLNEHVIHLLSFLDGKDIPYQLELEDFNDHSQIGKYYPRFVYEHFNNNLR